MKRFILIAMIVLVAMATLLTSCATAPTATTTPAATATVGPTEPPKPATVTFANFTASGDMQVNLDKMQAEFKKQYDYITLQSETIAFGDYFTQIQTRVAAGTAPDCYELNYENFVSYAKKGVLLDLAPDPVLVLDDDPGARPDQPEVVPDHLPAVVYVVVQ